MKLAAGDSARDPDAFLAAYRWRAATDAGQVRFDAVTGLKRPNTWREVVADWKAGRDVNRAQWHRFDANEVALGNRKVLDSYLHREEIVSRKLSQLADLEPATARSYLNEFKAKYAPGSTISDTARGRQVYPHLAGEKLKGRYVLELPVLTRPIPGRRPRVRGRSVDLDPRRRRHLLPQNPRTVKEYET
ncbi:MAG: hypothetical protein ACRCSN_14585 [Dermatophilaceae bacterium]